MLPDSLLRSGVGARKDWDYGIYVRYLFDVHNMFLSIVPRFRQGMEALALGVDLGGCSIP